MRELQPPVQGHTASRIKMTARLVKAWKSINTPKPSLRPDKKTRMVRDEPDSIYGLRNSRIDVDYAVLVDSYLARLALTDTASVH